MQMNLNFVIYANEVNRYLLLEQDEKNQLLITNMWLKLVSFIFGT